MKLKHTDSTLSQHSSLLLLGIEPTTFNIGANPNRQGGVGARGPGCDAHALASTFTETGNWTAQLAVVGTFTVFTVESQQNEVFVTTFSPANLLNDPRV